MKWAFLVVPGAVLGLSMACTSTAEQLSPRMTAMPESFPRIMSMNIGAKNYDDPEYQDELSRPAVVILGFYPGWRGKNGEVMRDVVRTLKKKHPELLVGQYTILSETYDPRDKRYADKDKGFKIDREKWWLTDKDGQRVQWTSEHNAWDVNITQWTKADKDGRRYPDWLAERDYATYFEPIPEFDIWYFDNAISKPAVRTADWNRDGRNDTASDPGIAQAHRLGHVAEWRRARELHSKIYFVGNSDDITSPEYTDRLQGVFMEALIGKSWSMERWVGWSRMMDRYYKSMRHTVGPHLVGFNVWGRRDDFQRMRFGLTSCLLDDGYFTYTDENVGYSSVPWFDEYEIDLGAPLDPPQTTPWSSGVYRRIFHNAMVLVNPESSYKRVVLEPGYKRFKGGQAPDINTGMPVTEITLQPKDGIILVKDGN